MFYTVGLHVNLPPRKRPLLETEKKAGRKRRNTLYWLVFGALIALMVCVSRSDRTRPPADQSADHLIVLEILITLDFQDTV